ncbi:hypothetical protein LMH87_002442 [Akanthomyces muscarius]|uniref:Uncharacterized protein n=1 Tax=Akanthomyces muscarius TaxID=2231603 RepID=A0A9W8Q8C9_AKAMU|nr:hypothetical protein LMH87_002442 [Akanthomyces muscarius]KAJ4147950.1 hypothetical protein LMH87_002442 [Akanthomyces muscarius]
MLPKIFAVSSPICQVSTEVRGHSTTVTWRHARKGDTYCVLSPGTTVHISHMQCPGYHIAYCEILASHVAPVVLLQETLSFQHRCHKKSRPPETMSLKLAILCMMAASPSVLSAPRPNGGQAWAVEPPTVNAR